MAAEEIYRNYCDLVCEGGGVKGIGLAGAFSVLSWGTGWGDKGFAYASLAYAQEAFTEAYGVEV